MLQMISDFFSSLLKEERENINRPSLDRSDLYRYDDDSMINNKNALAAKIDSFSQAKKSKQQKSLVKFLLVLY
jgi:hypothetical protein